MKYIYFFYSIFIVFIVLFSYLFIDPNLSYLRMFYTGFSFTNRLITTLFFVLFIVVFFVFYLLFIKIKKINLSYVKNLVLISAVCLTFSYPTVTSYDIFNYMSSARVAYYYKENPYMVMPNEFIGDEMLSYTRASNKTVLYGPVWVILTSVPYVLGFSNFFATLLLFKVLVGMFYLGLVFLIYNLSQKNLQKTLFFALNPLVLLETFVAGHNDVVMIFFTVLSYYFLTKKKISLSVLFLILSILIKFATLILIPVYIFVIYKILKKEKFDFQKLWIYSFLLMAIVFLLSPLREELYPWYAIWLIPFVSLMDGHKTLKRIIVAFCFGLLLSYVPYMLTGVYSLNTYVAKHILIIIPIALTLLFGFFKHEKNI